MSWSIKIAGKPSVVAAALRSFNSRPNIYPDPQRDQVFDVTASQVEQMPKNPDEPGYLNGVIVEGNGHSGSVFSMRVEMIELASEPVVVVSTDPAGQPPESAPQAAPEAAQSAQ
jgi:hypothetical protein